MADLWRHLCRQAWKILILA